MHMQQEKDSQPQINHANRPYEHQKVQVWDSLYPVG